MVAVLGAVCGIDAGVKVKFPLTEVFDGDVGCLGDQRCLTHGLWHALGGHIAAFLEKVSLQEVLDGIPAAKLAVQALPERELALREHAGQEVAAAR